MPGPPRLPLHGHTRWRSILTTDVKASASKAISQIVEHDLRRRHEEEGDRLAIFECISFCHKLEDPLPSWAMSTLAKAVERSWDGGCKSFYEGLFGPGPKGGPHANPLTKRRDEQKRDLINTAIDVVKENGYRGEEAHEMVRKVLAGRGLHRGVDTIRTDWTRRGKHGPSPLGMRFDVHLELRKLQNDH